MSEYLFRTVDVETTGYEPPDAEIIEIGVTDVLFTPGTKEIKVIPTLSFLFSPTKPIPPENRAVHHIADAELVGAPVCTIDHLKAVMMNGGRPFAFVAHNAPFERQWFTDEVLGDGVHVIDTFKVALRCYDEAPGHNNSTLRYWLELNLDPALAAPAHRAGPDSYVTAHILAKMLETERVADLVGWTKAPRYYATCPLTKHKGAKWCDVPHDFLNWMANKPNDLDEDLKAVAREEINQRRSR